MSGGKTRGFGGRGGYEVKEGLGVVVVDEYDDLTEDAVADDAVDEEATAAADGANHKVPIAGGEAWGNPQEHSTHMYMGSRQ